jgi:hypothetical protein
MSHPDPTADRPPSLSVLGPDWMIMTAALPSARFAGHLNVHASIRPANAQALTPIPTRSRVNGDKSHCRRRFSGVVTGINGFRGCLIYDHSRNNDPGKAAGSSAMTLSAFASSGVTTR